MEADNDDFADLDEPYMRMHDDNDLFVQMEDMFPPGEHSPTSISHLPICTCGRSSCGRADRIMDSHTIGPGFKTRLVQYFLPSLPLITTIPESVECRWCVVRSGKYFPVSLVQDIKMGSCVFQCDVPHQWIAQRQFSPVSVYCDGVGCHDLCLWYGIPVWQDIGQSITATSRHCRNMTSDV